MTARILADLALAAVRLRLDGPFVVRQAACALDPQGAGRVEIGELRRLFSRATLRRALETPFFRGTAGGQIYYASIAQAVVILGVEKPRAAGFRMPLNALTTGAARRRATLVLSSISARRGKKPISIDAIAAEAGTSRRTVFTWLKTTRWPRRRRYALHPGIVSPGTLRWLVAARAAGEPFVIVKRRGRLRVARREPNALGQKFTTEVRKGLARRARRRPVPSANTGNDVVSTGLPLPDPKSTTRERPKPSAPEIPALLSAEIVGEDFERSGGTS